MFVQIILLPQIEGLGPVHPISFLRFSKMFLRISMDATYNCNRLDLQSGYSIINNNHYV